MIPQVLAVVTAAGGDALLLSVGVLLILLEIWAASRIRKALAR